MLILLILSYVKMLFVASDYIFITVELYNEKITFDSLDGLLHSPRYMALFTISFLNQSSFKGD